MGKTGVKIIVVAYLLVIISTVAFAETSLEVLWYQPEIAEPRTQLAKLKSKGLQKDSQQSFNLLASQYAVLMTMGEIDAALELWPSISKAAAQESTKEHLDLLEADKLFQTAHFKLAEEKLSSRITTIKHDEVKAWALLRLNQSIMAQANFNQEKALIAAQQALEVYEANNHWAGIGHAKYILISVYEKDKSIPSREELINTLQQEVEKIANEESLAYLSKLLIVSEVRKKFFNSDSDVKAKLVEKLKLLQKSDYGEMKSLGNYYIGEHKRRTGELQEGIRLLESNIEYRKKRNNKKKYAGLIGQLSTFYRDALNYEKSFDLLFEQFQICEENGFYLCASIAANNIGIQYRLLKRPDKALEYFEKSHDIELKAFGKVTAASVYNNLGNAHADLGNTNKAYENYEKAIEAAKLSGNRRSEILANILIVKHLVIEKQSDKALARLKATLPLAESHGNKEMLGFIYHHFSILHRENNELDLALEYMERNLKIARELNLEEVTRDALEEIYTLSQKLGQFKKASRYQDEFIELLERKTKKIADETLIEKMEKYDAELKAKEIENLNKSNLIKQNELEKQQLKNRIQFFIFFAALMIVALGSIAYIGRRENIKVKKQVEEKTRDIELLLEKYAELYQNFSHEFRTPISIILGNLERLRKNRDSSTIDATIQTLTQNSQNLSTLVERVIDLSRIENLKQGPHCQSALDALAVLIDGFRSQADAENKALEFEINNIGDVVPISLTEESFGQVVRNLLSNALKYSEKNGKVVIQCAIKASGKELEIVILNSGQGIKKEDLPRIFDRFYRTDSARQSDVIGSGLGLAITKDLVEQAGGSIQVSSEPGKNTSFTVNLPIENRDSLANMNANNRVEEYKTANVDTASFENPPTENGDLPLVLVIEDNADLTALIADSLSTSYRVITASNGQEGIELAIEKNPHLIVSDISMPKKDGFEVLKHIKENIETSHIPVILLTARAGVESRIQGWQYNADGYITKPFSHNELLALSSSLLTNREKMRREFEKATSQDQADKFLETNEALDPVSQRMMSQLSEYLKLNLANSDLQIDTIAQHLNMSPRTYQRKIKSITGLSPTEYLKRRRLNHARQLIHNKLSISEAAYQSGFSSPSYFSTSYRAQFGYSPSEEINKAEKKPGS